MARQRAVDRHELHVPLWRIHRTVGMGGDTLVGEVDPLPGSRDLVRALAADGRQVALAGSGGPELAERALDSLGVRDDTPYDVQAATPADLLDLDREQHLRPVSPSPEEKR